MEPGSDPEYDVGSIATAVQEVIADDVKCQIANTLAVVLVWEKTFLNNSTVQAGLLLGGYMYVV